MCSHCVPLPAAYEDRGTSQRNIRDGPNRYRTRRYPKSVLSRVGEDRNCRWIIRKSKPCSPSRNQCLWGTDKPKPSTFRLSHYQHFMLMWQDQQFAMKITWALSIMDETFEQPRPKGHAHNHSPTPTTPTSALTCLLTCVWEHCHNLWAVVLLGMSKMERTRS